MEADPGLVPVGLLHRFQEAGLRVQSGYLVLVLVAQQSEVAFCDGFGQRIVVRSVVHTPHERPVAVGQRLVLVVGQEIGAPLDQGVE